MRDWLPGGMPYAELYKGMQVDGKVFDYDVRIIRIEDGPDAGDAYVLVQDLYRIALASIVIAGGGRRIGGMRQRPTGEECDGSS